MEMLEFFFRWQGRRVDGFLAGILPVRQHQNHFVLHDGNHVHMGTAGVIQCKPYIRLFAAYQGVYHIGGIAFDIQGKAVV